MNKALQTQTPLNSVKVLMLLAVELSVLHLTRNVRNSKLNQKDLMSNSLKEFTTEIQKEVKLQ